MNLTIKNIDKLIVVGDRVLVKPKSLSDRTKSPVYFYLPQLLKKKRSRAVTLLKSVPVTPSLLPKMMKHGRKKKKRQNIFRCRQRKATLLFIFRNMLLKLSSTRKNISSFLSQLYFYCCVMTGFLNDLVTRK